MGDNFDAGWYCHYYGGSYYNKNQCTECIRDATFVSPRLYCDEHWCRWWGRNDDTGRMYREAKFERLTYRMVGPVQWLCWRAFDLMELIIAGRSR